MPISVCLTREERDHLIVAAGKLSLSQYIRSRLFQGNAEISDEEVRLSPIARQKLLARLLMQLGQSKLTKNLNELGDAARVGLLYLTPAVKTLLDDLHNELRGLRRDLIKALGLRPNKDGSA